MKIGNIQYNCWTGAVEILIEIDWSNYGLFTSIDRQHELLKFACATGRVLQC